MEESREQHKIYQAREWMANPTLANDVESDLKGRRDISEGGSEPSSHVSERTWEVTYIINYGSLDFRHNH